METIGCKKKQNSIVELLRDEILSGNLQEGMEMTQNELAESLGVSRMPVREALILLEYQGLIERLPSNHVRVTRFAEGYFNQVFSMCAEIEEKSLNSGNILAWEKKNTRFVQTYSEEMAMHYQMCQNIANSFIRKTLKTILDIYVEFAVQCKSYDKEKGTNLLKSIISVSNEQRRDVLDQYFYDLEKAILIEREGIC